MIENPFSKHIRFLSSHTTSLEGKTIAITGSTGGLGRALCRYLAALHASLVLIDRDASRSQAHKQALCEEFEHLSVTCVPADLSDMHSVKAAVDTLKTMPLDVFIHNAGAYSIPRTRCDTGFDILFQINFVSPYYMIRRLLPTLRERRGRVVAVGSIAHRYSKTRADNVDFANCRADSKTYGNAKRYLMFALQELFSEERTVSLSIVHPGISFTGITDHYPPWLFALIKHPMKVLFMKPHKACLPILLGVFEPCAYGEWIGPRFLDVWGYPRKTRLRSADASERAAIDTTAQTLYNDLL